jgi:hypothetical protein
VSEPRTREQLGDAARLALLNAAAEIASIQIIAGHGLSELAKGRVEDALDVIRGALRLERLAAGMGAGARRSA